MLGGGLGWHCDLSPQGTYSLETKIAKFLSLVNVSEHLPCPDNMVSNYG